MFVAAVVVTAVCNVTSSSQVTFKGRFQYQSHTEPAFVPPPIVNPDSWYRPLETPVRVRRDPRHSVALAAPATVIPAIPRAAFVANITSPVIFQKAFQYPSLAYTSFVPTVEVVTLDKWFKPFNEPVRFKRIHVSEQAPSFIAPIAVITPVNPDLTGLASSLSSQVTFRKWIIYESEFRPILPPERITEDKWHFPWSEPSVKQKQGLRTNLQQAFIAPVLNPETQITQDFESRWHFAWSEPVRIKRQVPVGEQQFSAYSTTEIITVDKWIYPWRDPVRQKQGLKANLQQALIAPVLTDDQITGTIESRWHQPWSEPVRFRRFPTAEQQAAIQGPQQTPEFITVDKWIYAWSEPVRQKIGLKTHLQQALIAPVLNPETQIIQDFESRWHFPWPEPVRIKRPLLTAQQQALIYQSAFFETLNIDKWGFAWSEPVRQKIGLKTHLQQAFIGLTLEPETQIIQDYESRWHFAWSEPVRVKRQVPAGEQQFLIQGPQQTPEFITVDKWIYPWADPVRQKIGLATRLQSAFIAPVLTDEQVTGTIESRWHQPWSEPLRSRRFPASEQQSYTAPTTSVFEVVTVDKWFKQFNEPVRQKIWLRTALQQAFIAPVLNPETQIIQGFESRWHQPWSEPTRRKPSVANQLATFWSAFTPAAAVVFEDSWHQAWSEPVRQRLGLKVALQQALAEPVIPNPTFVAVLSSQVVYQRTFQYPSSTQPTFVPDVARFESAWHQPWSQPLYRKRGLGHWLQRATTLETPAHPNLIRTISWFAPLSEPVRLKIGLGVGLQKFFQTSQEQILSDIILTLSATETNADSAFFGITAYNAVPVVSRVPTTVVSIKEIPAIQKAAVSTEEVPAIDNASVSIEET